MSTDSTNNEHLLLQQISTGDQQAFSRLVNRYTKILFPYLLSWVKNTQQVEEIVQDVFVQIWKKRDQLVQIGNFSGYLYIIARNRAIAVLKEQLIKPESIQNDVIDNLLSAPQSNMETKELGEIINKAIDALPARRKEVFTLSREEKLTYEEIAERLRISRSTVREHIVEALVFLRMYLREHGDIILAVLPWVVLFVSAFA